LAVCVCVWGGPGAVYHVPGGPAVRPSGRGLVEEDAPAGRQRPTPPHPAPLHELKPELAATHVGDATALITGPTLDHPEQRPANFSGTTRRRAGFDDNGPPSTAQDTSVQLHAAGLVCPGFVELWLQARAALRASPWPASWV